MHYLHLTQTQYLDGVDVTANRHQTVLHARLTAAGREDDAVPRGVLKAIAWDHDGLIRLDISITTLSDLVRVLPLPGLKRAPISLPTMEFSTADAPAGKSRVASRHMILERIVKTIAFNAQTPQDFLDAVALVLADEEGDTPAREDAQ